ncbi:ATP-binding cassette domain-containing protein [Pontibacillus yanchengensis]|uniref:ATP-binding cassette domain-containing protein n=2 Tax=Pontibacillus yanchengensis TaxID=462910 RepID=A0ACC7VF54_9BACI|nr:ABC transporter ATP-binding protein [Pontibacillus yanchengensis]MYL32170.1 ATP-binding cassette domain-containing protein [Pontibacillus yanchengensis]MYL52750.1 ATP-binding cassette domain-containing protein [Pontibacillus yanchengensis]
MEKTPVAELINVKKRIGKTTIIDDISLEVFPGEVFGFLGPNGAGKTTTIRMMVGLMDITEGEILIHNHSIEKNYEKAIAHVGGIIENPEMYKFLSGYDNLIHYARMVPTKITKDRIQEVVKLVGLEKSIKNKVGSYSLGMRQRLGLAQALLHSPSLLILDEPTNGLDPAGIREIRNYIRRIAHEENMAVFVSSHLLAEMQLLCDRIAIIQNGRLISVETVGDFVGSSSKEGVRFYVSPLDKAVELLNSTYESVIVNEGKDFVDVSVTYEEIANMNELFVKHNMNVYGITTIHSTLEEKFLEITGGGK